MRTPNRRRSTNGRRPTTWPPRSATTSRHAPGAAASSHHGSWKRDGRTGHLSVRSERRRAYEGALPRPGRLTGSPAAPPGTGHDPGMEKLVHLLWRADGHDEAAHRAHLI